MNLFSLCSKVFKYCCIRHHSCLKTKLKISWVFGIKKRWNALVQFFCPVKILNLWFKILLKLVVIMTCFREDRSEHQIPFGWKSGWRFWGSVTDFVKNWGTTLEQKPSELWTYSKVHLIYESALMKLPELWLNLMKSGVVSLWLWLIWHSNHSSSLLCFPRSLVYNVNLVRKAALEYSRCDYILQCFVANRVTKHFRNNNLHGNFLSELCEVACRIHSHFHGFSGCLPLVRFWNQDMPRSTLK